MGRSRLGDSSQVQDQLRNVKHLQVAGTVFAAISADGSLVMWGSRAVGRLSRCSAIQDQLRNVQQLQATLEAFAAILADGSVVTWGSDKKNGGDSSEVVSCRMTFKPQLESTRCSSGVVLLCDLPRSSGEDISEVGQLNVQEFALTDRAFAAILIDGSVVTFKVILHLVVTVLKSKACSLA